MPEILSIGLNHKVAPVAVRERLAFHPDHLPSALKGMAQPAVDGAADQPAEVVILATCNRTEVYTASPENVPLWDPNRLENQIITHLAAHSGLQIGELRQYVYIYRGNKAVHHLFTVAAGLDSLVPGENEILGQVKTAAEIAHQNGTSGPTLSALFRHAAHCGKRVRSETDLGHAGRSVAQVVVDLAEETFGPLTQRTALLIGAGKISSLAAQALQRAGLHCILIANRTYARAERLAERIGGKAVHFDHLDENLVAADIVICSTCAPHIVLHTEAVAAAVQLRPDRPLLIADLAVPRDVDPAVGALPPVRLADIDGLQELACRRYPLSAAARLEAEKIVDATCAEFETWLLARRSAPLIHALQAQADEVCRQQVAKTRRRLGKLTPEQEEAITVMSRAIAGQLLHGPILHLRQPPADVPAEELAALIERLYGLGSPAINESN